MTDKKINEYEDLIHLSGVEVAKNISIVVEALRSWRVYKKGFFAEAIISLKK